jgi:hypothetical protein
VIYSTDEFPFTKLGIDFGSANTGRELTGWEEVNQFAFLAIPEDYYLAQNFPNPFNPLTEIAFGLPKNCQLEIKVFDILGREVAVLYNGWMNAGEHTISFDAGQLSSGIYFYSMKTDEFNCVKKMLLLK